MTINTQSLGSNSWYVAYTAGETTSALKTAVEAVILNAGWSVHDSAAGTDKIVYKAPVANSGTFKYLMLDWSNASYMAPRVFETWNASTHVGTNECALNGSAFSNPAGWYYGSQGIDLVGGGYIYIFATARYAIFLNKIISTGYWGYGNLAYQFATGCVEFAIENDFETVGTCPNFGLFSSNSLNGNLHTPAQFSGIAKGGVNYTDTSFASCPVIGFRYLSIPRSVDGSLSVLAERKSNVQALYDHPRSTIKTSAFFHCPWGSGCYVAGPGGYNQYMAAYPSYYTIDRVAPIFSWNVKDILPTGNNSLTNMPWCITPRVIEMSTADVNKVSAYRGRMFGVKYAGMGKNWNWLDSVNVLVDSDLFHSSLGTSHSHYYLGNNVVIPA